MSATACPVAGCDRLKSRSHLMCRPHWRRVPKPLQTEVLDSWAALKHREPDDDLRTIVARYRLARDGAIGAVTLKESQGSPKQETVS